MGTPRLYIHISPSIKNFEDKILKRTGLTKYNPVTNLFSKVIFFGCYRPTDYLRVLFHFGPKTIFWCGGDILSLQKSKWHWLIKFMTTRHCCENEIEQSALRKLGISAMIYPMIFDGAKISLSFTPNKKPHIYLTAHPGREKDYGVDLVLKMAPLFPAITFHIYGLWSTTQTDSNVVYHGPTNNKRFNAEIKDYQAAIRLNKFDGFSEILAKSALMGQYPISWIPYPHINHVHDAKSLRIALEGISKKKHPNLEARQYWLKTLRDNLTNILYGD